MATNWTDPTITTSTHIRATHINELRSVVDQNRQAAGLGGYAWTDTPVTSATHIRAVHFTELRSAIQDLWNHGGMGGLPNWSYGSAPAPGGGRPISARDTTALRTWTQQYEDHMGSSVDPARLLGNGLHWNSPVTNDSTIQGEFNAGQGFDAALVLAFVDNTVWQGPCGWLRLPPAQGGPKRPTEITVRLYWPCANPGCAPGMAGSCNLPGTGPELAEQFYTTIVKPAIQNYGISNFQVLNELDAEFEASCGGRAQLAGYMFNLAYWIKRYAYNDGLYPAHPIYLGFPGPSGALAPKTSGWDDYWNTYAPLLTRKLDFVGDLAYNWLAVHAYGGGGSGSGSCLSNLENAYDDLVTRIPNYPQRYTEWSIPNTDPNRITDMVNTLNGFRSYVTTRAGVDVYAMHAYIAYYSNNDARGDLYNLTASDAGPIANVF